jgi:hypothetical protein
MPSSSVKVPLPISRLITAICLGVAALTGFSATAEDAKRPDKVSFYFAAHEDDWQLFVNPSAFQDVMNGAAKTVFVHLTAGDAGLGVGKGGRKHPFYLARENGAEAAIRFMADAEATPGERIAAPMSFNGHGMGSTYQWSATAGVRSATGDRARKSNKFGGEFVDVGNAV